MRVEGRREEGSNKLRREGMKKIRKGGILSRPCLSGCKP